jgi:hypothetical protein
MRKYIFLVVGMLMIISAVYSQNQSVTFPENFDGNTSTFTSSPASAWKIDNNYYVNSPNCIRGVVPNMVGDETTLTSPVYDFSNYSNVLLCFSHICKVSPQDIVRIEYKSKGTGWQILSASGYMGDAIGYLTAGFNTNSYLEWRMSDSLTLPLQSWWKKEVFDVSFETATEDEVQFRFVLKHGNTIGTQISYGWLIDNIEITAALYELNPPAVEFVAPLIKDTVYSMGPWEINAKVKSQTIVQIENPWLVYIATNSQNVLKDSILMTHIKGDSLWRATIPQFIPGTRVIYSITGRDMIDNKASIESGYVIVKPNHNYGDTSVALTSIISPVQGQIIGGVTTPVEVTIRNKGDSALTSATIYWTVNGVNQQPYYWTGDLLWDFEQRVPLGSYTFRSDDYDTIKVWVSLPNGIPDIILTDDTVSVIIYGCSANMSGDYTVGQGGVFPSVADALAALKLCPPTGDITLKLMSGIYQENWDLNYISEFMGNHTLTITSLANNKDSVILRPVSGVGIQLKRVDNLRIEAITVDVSGTGTTYGIDFTSTGTSNNNGTTFNNVTITRCSILSDTTSTATNRVPVRRNTGTTLAYNISITHNTISGGYYGIQFYAGSGSMRYGQNIVIDSNIISSQYNTGILISYIDTLSVSYNRISSRVSNTTTAWTGLTLSYCNGIPILGNRILQRSSAITVPCGMSIANFNINNNTTDTGLIANNEFILSINSTSVGYSGIYISGGDRVRIVHNSIYISGSGGQGIAGNVGNGGYMEVKNNNIVMRGSTAYPIYILGNLTGTYDIDYNNMYAPNYIGNVGNSAKVTITAWQQIITSDRHSISIDPVFIDNSIDLQMLYLNKLDCDLLAYLPMDINGNSRLGTTTMGCYQDITSYSENARLIKILNGQPRYIGASDTVKVEFANMGSSPLHSATIHWSFNGSLPQPFTVSWQTALAPGALDTITLGTITHTLPGYYNLKAWLSGLGTQQDEFSGDDTVSKSDYICSSVLNGGTYTIGATGCNFSSIADGLNEIRLCGINGDITFQLQTGRYQEDIDLTDMALYLGNYSLTFTSMTGNPSDATVETKRIGIQLYNTNNIILNSITIDSRTNNVWYGINFLSSCTNIVITNCIFLADTVLTTNMSSYTPIFKNNNTGVIKDISITNNIVDGGYSGISLSAGTGTGTNVYAANINIESNRLTNQCYRAIYLQYADSVSISNNVISSRSMNTNTSWTGLYIDYCNGNNITGNRIFQQSNAIMYPYGIEFQFFNYYNATDTGLIANNEIRLNTTSIYSGIWIRNQSKAKILHNSIYITGTGAGRGIQMIPDNTGYLVVKNNNIVMESSTAYPIYLNNNTSLEYCDIDYNNMYAPQYAGYVAEDILSMDKWRKMITTDRHSIRVNPIFVNNTLQPLYPSGLDCDLLPDVPMDIIGNNRFGITTMGCYQDTNNRSVNGKLVKMIKEETNYTGVVDTVKAIFVNMGTSPLTEVTLNWSLNGNLRTPITVSWQNSLASKALDTISLGTVTHTAEGNYSIKIWITKLGTLQDQFPDDDTLLLSGYVCSSLYTGDYTVGASGYFTSIQDALNKISVCGMNGDITLKLLPGVYQEDIDLAYSSLYTGNYTLTLTSDAGNALGTTIETQSKGIELAQSNNIVISDITIDTRTNKTFGINFLTACTNIVITRCTILADTTWTSWNIPAVINKGVNNSWGLNNIVITHNILEGGYDGIYLRCGSISAYGTGIFIDSNIISKQYETGILLNYVDSVTVSNNRITSRTANTIRECFAVRLEYINGIIINNSILQQNSATTLSLGIFLGYLNVYNTTDTGIVANNEIINTAGTSEGQGIWANYSNKARIIHNSIYISGTGNARGIQIANNPSSYMTVKNNNIVLEPTGGFPVYMTAYYLNLYNLDYNNMYAPTYIGYAGGNKTTMSDWQQTITTDKHSVNIRPNFIDSSVSLDLLDYSNLLSCPLYKEVAKNIKGGSRADITTIGAYSNAVSFDLGIKEIISTTEVTYPQPAPVKIVIANTGINGDINSATFGWSLNGEVQSSYTWNTGVPLSPNASTEVAIGSFNSTEKTQIFDIVVWIEGINGGVKDSIKWNDTIRTSVRILFTGNNLRIVSMEQLVPEGVLCVDDYVPLIIKVQNTGTLDYDFTANPVTFSVRVTQPEPYSLDMVISTGEIKSGENVTIVLTDTFPIVVAGRYDIKIWMDSVSNIIYDDTLSAYYVSGKFGLPIDDDFSNGMPIAFTPKGLNTSHTWQVISQATGTDTTVTPQFGTGMLSFTGSPGSMTTLFTQPLDLSRTVQPSLSFWYFHDTVPAEDYTDVFITIDGGTTYNTLFSLTKYNPVYGWQQYSMDLPGYAVGQCVILVFEAMEKSRSGDVTQYIDRILITAKQDIAVTEVLISSLAACDLQNKEVKVVLSNLTDPVLDFTTTPTTLTLEILETGQTYTHLLDSGSLGRFASDTIMVATGVNFTKGIYTLKAYFSSVLDVDRMNDTLATSIVINPELSVNVYPESSPANCLTGALVVNPTITLYNTGNMDLSNIDLILQVDTGENNTAVYALLKEMYTGTILAGDTATYMFNSSYSVPWNARYDVRTYIYLSCDSAMVNSTNMVQECVDIKDLRIISIDNPPVAVTKDAVGSSIQVTATLNNRSDGDVFTDIPINVRITNSQGIEQETFMEPQTIGASATVSHAFTKTYTVPNDSVYYLSVFVNSQDNYRDNDTLTMKRYTESVGIETLKSIGGFTLYQNIPNPANNRTRIDYSIPESGEVVFNLHSVSGQLLYSRTIEASSGKQSIELNTSSFAAGIYLYSIEYKGQRLVKRMMISD